MDLIRLMLSLVFLVPAAFAQAGMLTFNATPGGVSAADAPDLTPQTGLTVEAWIFYDPNAVGGTGTPTIARKDPIANVYALRNINGTRGYLQWLVSAPGQPLPTILHNPLSTPQLIWSHVAGTYDGTMVRLYLDGFLVNSASHSGLLPVTTGAFRIGIGATSADMWKGNIDEVRIWSVARTGSEIQSTMYKRIDNEPNLVAAWHFDGDYLDLTGAHHGIPGGGAVIAPSTSPVKAVYLEAPDTSGIGAPLPFTVHTFPTSSYVADVSLNGILPGTPIPPPGSGTIPLNMPFAYSAIGGIVPSIFQGFIGVTDSIGEATPMLLVPDEPFLAGIVISAAFAVVDASAPFGIGTISNPTQTLLTP